MTSHSIRQCGSMATARYTWPSRQAKMLTGQVTSTSLPMRGVGSPMAASVR